MALDFPSGVLPEEVNWTPRVVVGISTSPVSLATQVQQRTGQLWEAQLSFPLMSAEKAQDMQGFFLALGGSANTFLMPPFGYETVRGVGTGTPLVDGASQTGTSIDTKGWTVSTTNILKRGDVFSLGSGDNARFYMVTSNADSDSSGDSTLSIWPRLRISPSDEDSIELTNKLGVFRIKGKIPSFDLRTIIGGTSFTVQEKYP